MEERNKILPCPKCGAKPEYNIVGDYNQYYAVCCRKCGYTAANRNEARCTKWGARRLWNKKVRASK